MSNSSPSAQSALRQLPSVDRVLGWPDLGRLIELYGRTTVRVQVRQVLEGLRQGLLDGSVVAAPKESALVRQIDRRVEQVLGGSFQRVLNATGIVLHTNLGRAPLPGEVLDRLKGWSSAACNLEFDLAEGRRGDRNGRLRRSLSLLTGCEDAIAVNNNAAALVLILRSLARGKEVVLSRGELVEIGGSFRIPEILEAAGCRLVEVGTTNRTRREDYERALGPETALVLKVHPSNYRVRGFTGSVAISDLSVLASRHEIPLVVDEGAGLLRPRPEAPFKDHESVQSALAAGANLVCSSADKVLGGPQAGLILGSADLVALCRAQPLYRALRPGRLVVASLEEILRRQLAGEGAVVDRLWPDAQRHADRLQYLAERLPECESTTVEGFVGGGAAPDIPVPAMGLSLPFEEGWVDSLRRADPPVIAYVSQGRMLVDLRTIDEEDDQALLESLLWAREAASQGLEE